MKILQLMPSSGFYGMERVVYNLSGGLSRAGVQVVVVTSPSLKSKFSELPLSSLYVLPEHDGRPSKALGVFVKMVVQYRRICSREKPDLVHVQGTWARFMALAAIPTRLTIETLQGVGLTKGEAFRRVMVRISDLLASVAFDGSVFGDLRIVPEYSRLRQLKDDENNLQFC